MNEEKKSIDSITVHDLGFVRLVDYMGDDARIVQSARVSYGSGTKSFREDRGLIRYLLRHDHTSPFEQVVFTFHIKMPIFVARQWIRHRTARLNEISARYSMMEDNFYVPAHEDINKQSEDNKQGRENDLFPLEESKEITDSMNVIHKEAYKTYEKLLEKGVAREIARIVLPTSLYTEMYWQMDLHNLFHFLRLRLDSHAQREIRVYAEAIYNIIKEICPLACEAFEDFVRNRQIFSQDEMEIIRGLIGDATEDTIIQLSESYQSNLSKRELQELIKKILVNKNSS